MRLIMPKEESLDVLSREDNGLLMVSLRNLDR